MSLCISIVSHGQTGLANLFLEDLVQHNVTPERLVLTQNIPDNISWHATTSQTKHLYNSKPRGFGANHNIAFEYNRESFFCVANPDIRLLNDPFPALLRAMEDPQLAVVSPLVINTKGELEDSARIFPTFTNLLNKAIGQNDGRHHIQASPHSLAEPVDWTAGMFLLFRSSAFKAVGGFDPAFHLYYEDVDICARLWNNGWKVGVSPNAKVVHDAQRTSRRNLRYMSWHAASMARYFWRHSGRLPPTAPSQR